MSGKHHFQDQAYVLHHRAYRNTSLISEVLTHQHGRLSLVVKGAKRGNAPLSATLQPYTPLIMEWGGQGELMTLYKAEPAYQAAHSLTGEALFHGFYINELLMRLLHRHDPHPELFEHYAQCLQDLMQRQYKDVGLRYFELQLLESLGYGMNLLQEITREETVSPDQDYHYLIEQGPQLTAGTDSDLLRVSGATLIALAERSLAQDSHRNEAKRLLRSVLDHYLGERPLKTRELMQSRKLWRNSTPTR